MSTKEKRYKTFCIPFEILENEELSLAEKVLFSEIDSFTSNGSDCFISNEYIAKLLCCSVMTARRTLYSLIKKGYINSENHEDGKRHLKSVNLYSNTEEGVQIRTPDCSNMNTEVFKNEHILYNNTNIINRKESKERKDVFSEFFTSQMWRQGIMMNWHVTEEQLDTCIEKARRDASCQGDISRYQAMNFIKIALQTTPLVEGTKEERLKKFKDYVMSIPGVKSLDQYLISNFIAYYSGPMKDNDFMLFEARDFDINRKLHNWVNNYKQKENRY